MIATQFRRMLTMLLAALPVLAATADAGDWYVDASTGANHYDGTSPASAWRTITHAVANTPTSGEQRIHVAPGVYDAALGEVYPLDWRPDLDLLGTQGPAVTILDGGGAASIVRMRSWMLGLGLHFTNATLVRGLSLRNAGSGVSLGSDWAGVGPTLEDLDIRGMTGAGVSIGTSGAGTGAGLCDAVLLDVRSHGNAYGLSGSLGGGSNPLTVQRCDFSDNTVAALDFTVGGNAGLHFEDCDLRQCSGDGLRIRAFNLGAVVLDFRRCRIVENGGVGVRAEDEYYASFTGGFEDCLISDNGGDGYAVYDSGYGVLSQGYLTRCTVANNGGVGVRSDVLAGPIPIELSSTIVYGNADDVLSIGDVSATYCDIGDGDFSGDPTNLSADPLFVDPLGGDYRLSWYSPCIEAGDPATPVGAPDLLGTLRNVDGDLDTLEAPDMGACEFAPLFKRSGEALGSILELEFWGPVGESTTVYFNRHGVWPPTQTPFGELDLDPQILGFYRSSPTAPGPPATHWRMIPNASFLIGLTFSFQALTSSPAAPQGFAWTNAIEITITP